MIELDGIQFNVKSQDENTADMISAVNTYCANNNVVNSDGDVIQVESNQANPLYVMFQGFAYLVGRLQSLLYSAGCALSIQSASEKQLLNIADMAGVKRKDPTKTTIVGTVFSDSADILDPSPCLITKQTPMTAVTTQGTVVFNPAFDVEIPVGSSATIVLVAADYGGFTIDASDNANFDVNPVGFRKMMLQASVPGQDIESIADLRLRLQRRTEITSALDRAIAAISQLDGVSLCNIYYNSGIEDIVMAGVTVKPRQALMFVQGWSDDIAKTYYANMVSECAGKDHPNAIPQIYTSRAGQEFIVPIIPPEQVPVNIRIYINGRIDDATRSAMKDDICTLAQALSIGEILTSAAVLQLLQEKYSSYPIAGAQVGTEGNYTYQVRPKEYQLLSFSPSRVQIFAQGD